MPTALELTREEWQPYIDAARRRPARHDFSPDEHHPREARGALTAGMTALPIRHGPTTCLLPTTLARLLRPHSRFADREAFDDHVRERSRQQLLNLVQ